MKLIVSGSRTIWGLHEILICYRKFMHDNCNPTITEVVGGEASRGIDTQVKAFADHYLYPYTPMPANWTDNGAGFRRNIDMANYGDALIAVWDGTSKGTKHMINTSVSQNMPTTIYTIDKVKDVGRNTPYGNPIRLWKPCPVCGKVHTIFDYQTCYKKYLWGRMKHEEWAIAIAVEAGIPVEGFNPLELVGHLLRCPGCGIGAATCHARIIDKAVSYLWVQRYDFSKTNNK